MVIYFGFLANIVNAETASLYGILKREIFMECLQGMSDIGKNDCIILNKCIYGLVQAVMPYYKKDVEISKRSRFVGGNVVQYLYVKKSEKGIV